MKEWDSELNEYVKEKKVISSVVFQSFSVECVKRQK